MDVYHIMNSIHIHENFLSSDEFTKVLEVIYKNGWKHDGKTSDNSPRFWFMDLIKNSLFTRDIFEKIQNTMNKKFKLQRVYANGQTYGQDGMFHIDDYRDDTYTFMIYISPITADNVDLIGGFTQFKIDNSIVNVEPYMNRSVCFKSNIVHRGLAPSRETDLLRISIAFKLIDIT